MDDKIKPTLTFRHSLNICTSCDNYEECVVEYATGGGGVDKFTECTHHDPCVRAYKLGMQDGQ